MCTVLLVENNPDDARLAQLAFERTRLSHVLAIVKDGAEAMDFLKAREKYTFRRDLPLPKLILLDLGMPGVTGFELLDRLKEEPELRNIPVAVLSGSNYTADMKKAYELGAKSFVEKPSDLGSFSASLKAVLDRWIGETGSGQASQARLSC